MNRVYVSIASIKRAAAYRPSGYEGDVLSAADEVTETHAVLSSDAYRRLCDKYQAGPGTELKSLLGRIGIAPTPGCACTKRARVMDDMGCGWCEQNIDTIDGWLAEEAGRRKLPYMSSAGKTLIRMAIRRSRKKGTKS